MDYESKLFTFWTSQKKYSFLDYLTIDVEVGITVLCSFGTLLVWNDTYTGRMQ